MAWMYEINEDGSISEWKGDSGPMSTAYWTTTISECEKNNIEYYIQDDNGFDRVIAYEHMAKPRVGVSMRVGSPYSRSYNSNKDYWPTTKVTEILEEFVDSDNRLNVKFKTKNSVYWWKQ